MRVTLHTRSRLRQGMRVTLHTRNRPPQARSRYLPHAADA
nr:MAG TPA_asm: hypothetical protein [Bacteriophage sp.]